MLREIGRAESQDINVCNWSSPNSKYISNNPSYACCRAAEGLDCARVVVCLNFCREPVCTVKFYNPCIVRKSGDYPVSSDLFSGASNESPEDTVDCFLIPYFDCRLEYLVKAMF